MFSIVRSNPSARSAATATDDPDSLLRAPALYALLREVFDGVRVGNLGRELIWRPVTTQRGLQAQICDSGEIYRFCCPYCGDTRYRGWVSHYFGQPDPISGRPMYRLVGCFNESCFRDDPQLRDRFVQRLTGRSFPSVTLPRCCEAGPARPRAPVTFPGITVELSELPDDHPARTYVRDRGFNPDTLSNTWGVGYCMDTADDHEAYCLHRLIIPLMRAGQLIGWQARQLGDGGRGKKYYNHAGMSKGGYLYGMDDGLKGRLAVLVEGVPSVWAMGPPVMAILGSTLGTGQRDTLRPIADNGGAAVVVFDPGAEDKAESARQDLQALFNNRVAVVTMPPVVTPDQCRRWPIPKIDPGELLPEVSWPLIAGAISEQIPGSNMCDFL